MNPARQACMSPPVGARLRLRPAARPRPLHVWADPLCPRTPCVSPLPLPPRPAPRRRAGAAPPRAPALACAFARGLTTLAPPVAPLCADAAAQRPRPACTVPSRPRNPPHPPSPEVSTSTISAHGGPRPQAHARPRGAPALPTQCICPAPRRAPLASGFVRRFCQAPAAAARPAAPPSAERSCLVNAM